MKTKYYICCLFVILLAACARDKGSYNYTEIDEITITGISNSYTIELEGLIKIPITIKHSTEGGGQNLSYSWKIDKMEVGTSKDLDYRLPAKIRFGTKPCLLTVTDEDTGMKFFKPFEITVVSPFNWGYYMLCKEKDGKSSIFYMPVRTKGNEGQELKPLRADKISDTSLGDNPLSLKAFFDDDRWTIICTTEEGEYPVIVTNNYTFSATSLVNSESFVDKGVHYDFSPEYAVINHYNNLYFITNGKLVVYIAGVLYRPSKHEKDYYWTNPIGNVYGYPYVCVFDEWSRKYYIITPQENIPEEKISGDPYAYDKVLPVTDFPELDKTNTIIGIVQTSEELLSDKYACITTDGKYINILPFSFSDESSSGNFLADEKITFNATEADEKITFNATEAGENIKVVNTQNDWYFVIGNNLHTSPMIMSKLTFFTKLPDGLGKVTDIKLSVNNKVLVAAFYNESESSELKGSLVYINIETKEKTVYKNIMGRCVSLLSCNADPDKLGMGDGN